MVEKIFRIMSNSEEHLEADVIAMALLKQITLNPREPDIVFGVAELPKEKEYTGRHKESVTAENQSN